MKIEFKLIDEGDAFDKPSKWIGVISRNNTIETFEYSMGCAHRKAKRRFLISNCGAKQPKGWRMGERIPQTIGRLTFDQRYYMEHNTEPIEPSEDDFLSCLVLDISCVRYGQSFEEFVAEFGYDEDSRKAEQVYNACRETLRKLTRLGIDLDELAEKYKDY